MDWTSLLEKQISRPCFDRPLVCDGLPDASSTIIIGENPGRNMKRDWWSYWNDSGFDYDRFMADYRAENTIRGSRLRFCRMRDAGVKAIETNFYRDQGLGGSKRKVSNITVIQSLIDNMPKLKFAILHGTKAHYLSRQLMVHQGLHLELCDHFRNISYPAIDALCQSIIAAASDP
jgi:hypothetical protein